MFDQSLPSVTLGQRIVVIGTTGSGKTTLARRLAQRFECPHVELDALHWEPGWQEAPLDVFRARVSQALTGDRWVVDGNYSKVRDLVWSRANTLVWLDYPLRVIMSRLLWRTLCRVVTQEKLWNDNHEEATTLFSRDSIVLWALKTYRRHRRVYPPLFQRPEYAHLQVVRLRSVRTTRRWLASIQTGSNALADHL
jgi:adenylate kinase family enzyme